MSRKTNLDWKTYESITKYIYETLGNKTGVKIIGHGHNFKVLGKSGVYHQIDVLTSHSDDNKTAIECKYWNKKVNKDTVMKLYSILEDTAIQKGIIVSRKGFTKDGAEFARHKNIGLVELRERADNDEKIIPRMLDMGELVVNSTVLVTRVVILGTTIEYSNKEHIKKVPIDMHASIRLADGSQKSIYQYEMSFKDEIRRQNKLDHVIFKRYETPGASLTVKDNLPIGIESINLSGALKEIDLSSSHTFSLVDEVWLIMKEIFEGKTFSITDFGIIVENKR